MKVLRIELGMHYGSLFLLASQFQLAEPMDGLGLRIMEVRT